MILTLQINKLKDEKSFTLVEILLAISIFTFLIMAALGVYMTSITKHRQALKSQVVNEDLQYATEVMYRDIKESYITVLSSDGTTLYLNHPTKNIIGDNDNDGMDDCEEKGGVECFYCSSADTFSCQCCLQYHFNSTDQRIEVKTKDEPNCTFDNNCPPITSSRTLVEDLDFYIDTRDVSNPQAREDQPKATILIHAKEKDDVLETSAIFLQMTVTQKEILNLYQGNIF